MKTDKQKQRYTAPDFKRIRLDNEISLQLESSPPILPNEGAKLQPAFSDDPFKSQYA